jgi:hypothetical protein
VALRFPHHLLLLLHPLHLHLLLLVAPTLPGPLVALPPQAHRLLQHLP